MAEHSYDRIADVYATDMGASMRFDDIGYYRDLCRRVGGKVLELGCGTGRILLPLLAAGVDIEGLDRSAPMLARLHADAAARGLAAKTHHRDLRTMPEDLAFDVLGPGAGQSRPGMYTDTTPPEPPGPGGGRQQRRRGAGRPRQRIEVGSATGRLAVRGRRRRPRHAGRHPPEHGVPGVELILTRCTPAASSPTRTTSSPAACTASACRWSTRCRAKVEVTIKRDGRNTAWASPAATGHRPGVIGTVPQEATPAPRVRFWPDPKYFDTPKFSVKRLRHVLRAKAVLCPGLTVTLRGREASGETERVVLRGRAEATTWPMLADFRELLPAEPSRRQLKKGTEAVDWALLDARGRRVIQKATST
jgi:hypothetical protein